VVVPALLSVAGDMHAAAGPCMSLDGGVIGENSAYPRRMTRAPAFTGQDADGRLAHS
jgi:hypothetical protein